MMGVLFDFPHYELLVYSTFSLSGALNSRDVVRYRSPKLSYRAISHTTRPLSDILLGGFRTWLVLNIEKVLQIDREALDVKN
uniref:Uncharacterized protein n=1 Tax=candidate division CPR3 bacterium TaxID=2268181 RepID=A0A7C5YS03_UNCC3